MVFPGRYSTGCRRCRQRRIKCDESKPACLRCKRYGTECPGYANEVLFRTEHPSERRVERQKTLHNPRNEGPAEKITASSLSHPGHLNGHFFEEEILVPKLQTARYYPTLAIEPCWESQSMSYFINQHVMTACINSVSGHLDYLPSLYLHTHETSCFQHATRANAYLSLYQYSKLEKLRVEACKSYGKALRAARLALESLNETMGDDLLATVLLLCFFEEVMGKGRGDDNAHIKGIIHALKMVAEHGATNTHVQKSMVGWALQQVLFRFLKSGTPHVKSQWFSPFITVAMPMPRIINFVRDMIDHCSQVESQRMEWACKEDGTESSSAKICLKQALIEAIHTAAEFEDDLNPWSSSVPTAWRVRLVQCDNVRIPLLRVYASTSMGCAYCLLNASFIHFSSRVISYCGLLITLGCLDPVDQRMVADTAARAETRIQEANAAICSSVAYIFGMLEANTICPFNPLNSQAACGYLMAWPLTEVLRSGYVSDEDTFLCKEALQNIKSYMWANLTI